MLRAAFSNLIKFNALLLRVLRGDIIYAEKQWPKSVNNETELTIGRIIVYKCALLSEMSLDPAPTDMSQVSFIPHATIIEYKHNIH